MEFESFGQVVNGFAEKIKKGENKPKKEATKDETT